MPTPIQYHNGQKIHNLILIKEMPPVFYNGRKCRKGLFECSCGKHFEASISKVKSKHTKSCGCFNIAQIKERFTKHGLTNSKLFSVWSDVLRRCFNKNRQDFQRYGGRGITVCDEWKNDFLAFYNWSMANGYKNGLSIDRINNDGNYEPSNCRWATLNVQARNTNIFRVTNTSGFRGVSWHKRVKKWGANIVVDRKNIYLGYYSTAKDAAIAYDNYVKEHNLEHTRNFA